MRNNEKWLVNMAESASNSEIEDVLSSIRRLVSQDIRRGEAAAAPARAEPDKLVLTPALRVEATAEPETLDVEDDDASALDTGRSDDPDAAPEAADWAEETDEAGVFEWEDEDHVAEVQETLYDEAEDAEPGDTPFPRQSALQAKIAELEALIGDRQEDWEPDAGEADMAEPVGTMDWDDTGSADDEDEAEWDQGDAAWDGDTDGMEAEFTEAEPEREVSEASTWADPAEAEAEVFEPEAREPEAFEPEGDEAEVDEPDVFELEEFQLRRTESEGFETEAAEPDTYEPEEAEPEAEAVFEAEEVSDPEAAPEGTDEGPERVNAQPRPEPASPHIASFSRPEPRLHLSDGSAFSDDDADDTAEDDLDLFSDDTLLDEEALRDMVTEIVRQELQGALGERITRNVRKLVRREIHRALNSQDFD